MPKRTIVVAHHQQLFTSAHIIDIYFVKVIIETKTVWAIPSAIEMISTKKFLVVLIIAVTVSTALVLLNLNRRTTSQFPEVARSSPTKNSNSAEEADTFQGRMNPASSTEKGIYSIYSRQCADDERLVAIPTSSQFTVDDPGPFCAKLRIGPTLASSDGKWTAAIESVVSRNLAGYLYYRLPQGPGVWEADHNLFVVLTNLSIGVKKEIGVASIILQGEVSLFAQGWERMESGVIGWSVDGKNLWGWASFATNAELGAGNISPKLIRASLFKIDTNTWQTASYLLPNDGHDVYVNRALSDVFNIDRGIVLYGRIIDSSTLSVNVYNLSTKATATIASFYGNFDDLRCGPKDASDSQCYLDTERLQAHWINSSTASWIDPQTGSATSTRVL